MYYLLGISVLAASFNSVLLNKSGVHKKDEIFKFNFLNAIVWYIILAVINKGKIHINAQVLLWGVVYGLTQALFILSKTGAMSSGPVAVTTLVGNSSLLISVLASLVIWREKVTITDVVGLALLLIAIALCTYKRTESTYQRKWKYYVVFFLVFAASVGVVFKAFGKSGGLNFCGDMMIVSAIVMIVFYLGAMLIVGRKENKTTHRQRTYGFIAYALFCGVLSCLYNRLNIFLSGSMDAIIFFPAFNGGVVLLSTLLSLWICKEKLEKRQAIGIALGIIAIALIGIL